MAAPQRAQTCKSGRPNREFGPAAELPGLSTEPVDLGSFSPNQAEQSSRHRSKEHHTAGFGGRVSLERGNSRDQRCLEDPRSRAAFAVNEGECEVSSGPRIRECIGNRPRRLGVVEEQFSRSASAARAADVKLSAIIVRHLELHTVYEVGDSRKLKEHSLAIFE